MMQLLSKKKGKSCFLKVTPPKCIVSGESRFGGIMQAALRSIMGGTLDEEIYWELQAAHQCHQKEYIRVGGT